MEDLQALRKRIDEIDRQLVPLFEDRMNTVIRVAEYKLQNGLPVLNAAREQQVLDKCVGLLRDKSYSEAVVAWMRNTMALSRSAEEKYLKEREEKRP